jgi:hypothetical protein
MPYLLENKPWKEELCFAARNLDSLWKGLGLVDDLTMRGACITASNLHRETVGI